MDLKRIKKDITAVHIMWWTRSKITTNNERSPETFNYDKG